MAQREAIEKLKHCLNSGDPRCVEEALQRAESCGLADVHRIDAEARLQELQTAERQLQSALETEDRVHLSVALEDVPQHEPLVSLVGYITIQS